MKITGNTKIIAITTVLYSLVLLLWASNVRLNSLFPEDIHLGNLRVSFVRLLALIRKCGKVAGYKEEKSITSSFCNKVKKGSKTEQNVFSYILNICYTMHLKSELSIFGKLYKKIYI